MSVPQTMTCVELTGHGGLDKLRLRTDRPVPRPGRGEVLIAVTAAGVNNTDINTRTGWYNSGVRSGTTAEGAKEGFGAEGGATGTDAMGDWSVALSFPRIQGADCAGRIVAVGEGVDPARLGERIICAPYVLDPKDGTGLESARFLGADFEGAFADFTVIAARNAITVPHDLDVDDTALATLPCSGGTAMNMVLLAGAKPGELAIVTGASGGVGSFLVSILKALGLEVVAVAGASKCEAVLALGADHVLPRDATAPAQAFMEITGGRKADIALDVVGGETFVWLIAALARGGRYVTAGAIAGPIVEFDLRSLYLKSLRLYGSTVYGPDTMPTLVKLVTEGKVRPVAHATYPLAEIRTAQEAFLEKTHVGSLVLIPPRADHAKKDAPE
ncbi:MAG: zinc-binding dehydrogenase [Pseudomonadota bacterium]